MASDYLDALAGLLGDLVTVYRYDQRGCGQSERKPPYDIPTYLADLEGLRSYWGVERWLVAGHSWGATLALLYALEYPERTHGLLYLAGTGITMDWQNEYRANRTARLAPEIRERARILRERQNTVDGDEADRIRQEYARLIWPTDFADTQNVPPYEEHSISVEVNVKLNDDWRRLVSDRQLSARVSDLMTPALILHGEGDPRPAWPARQLAELITNARFELIAGAGHMPWHEQPGQLREHIQRFMRSLD